MKSIHYFNYFVGFIIQFSLTSVSIVYIDDFINLLYDYKGKNDG